MVDISIEGLAKTLGSFAAYFALYESYLLCFQPNGTEKLEAELGPYIEWFFQYNHLDQWIPAQDVSTISEKAQFIAVLQMIAALPVVLFTNNKLFGLCLLSWFYMTAVRGHVQLQTPYVPVVLTMFGFTHVALVTHLLGGVFSGWGNNSGSSSGDETTETTTEQEATATQDKNEAKSKSKTQNRKKKKS